MGPPTRLMTCAVCAAGLLAALATGRADPPAAAIVKDRAAFIPNRRFSPLPGKAIGLLVFDGQPVLSSEGRFGPPDEVCFAANGSSYRWIYVVAQGKPQISNLRVPIGDKGEVKIHPALDMARAPALAARGITAPCTLAEVEVNGGGGSPANDSFVATAIQSVEGTPEYPLRTAKVVADLRRRYAALQKEKAADIAAAMKQAQKKALQDRRPTGPREQADLMFLSWMSESKRLRVHFRTTVSDGAYQYVGGGARPIRDPIPLPPLPGGLNKGAPLAGATQAFPPPPPRDFKVRVGITFGVVYGMGYEIAKDGSLVRSELLSPESFQRVLPPPPAAPRGRPVALPPSPARRPR
jgi:hypothetical protein